MKKERDIRYVEAIKLAAGGAQYKNLSVKDTLADAILQLKKYYEISNEKGYLEIAILYIQAFLEMGFAYDDKKEVFDEILGLLDLKKEIQFPNKLYTAKKVKLNKSQVRNMIGRWPASPSQTMKINDVIKDIIDKVNRREKGIFYYQCGVTDDRYELVINEKEIFFHDLRKNLFYTFVL